MMPNKFRSYVPKASESQTINARLSSASRRLDEANKELCRAEKEHADAYDAVMAFEESLRSGHNPDSKQSAMHSGGSAAPERQGIDVPVSSTFNTFSKQGGDAT
jgi:hypothetical protein